MSTISINPNHLVTSRPSNLFQWIVEHSGGKIFTQYGEPGRSFRDIQKLSDEDLLDKLYLVRLIPDRENEFSADMRPCFTVDFRTGYLTINGDEYNENPDVDMKGAKLRPIYFRRVRGGVGINQGVGYASLVKYYWIGWQATIDGKNYQLMIQYDVPNNIPNIVRKR